MTNTDRELTISETNEFEMLVDEIREGIHGIGARLLKIREGKLYRGAYESFEEFVQAEFSFSVRRAQQLMNTVRVINNIEKRTNGSPTGSTILPNERQSRELLHLDPAQQAEAWEEVIETAASEKKKPTAKMVKAVVEKKRRRTAPLSSSNARGSTAALTDIPISSSNGHDVENGEICPTCHRAGYVLKR